MPDAIDLRGRVALVTGAGSGLGRAYAMELARLGASVVVNDPGTDKATGKHSADLVAVEIQAAGGKATANKAPVTKEYASAEAIVKTALDAYGKIDIVVNNAGILRDVSFIKQSFQDWAAVQDVHLWGQRNIAKAAWEPMVKQGYGRLVNIGSINGMRGAFGQSNYAAAKSGIIGLTKTLALEGAKRNIKINMVLPWGGTAMTATVMPKELVEVGKPELAAPLVAVLCSDDERVPTGMIFESGGGYMAEWQFRRSEGAFFDISKGSIAIEDVLGRWKEIRDMSQCTDPIEEDKQLPKQSRLPYELSQKKSKL